MAKPKTYEEALELMDAKKEKLSELKQGLREWKKENKIKRNKPVEDEKLATQLTKKEEVVTKAQEAYDTARDSAKELKPQKDRVSKYEYPADCITDKDKKRYRAKMRRDAKAGEKPEKESKVEKDGKPKPKKKIVKKESTKSEEEED